MVSGSVCSAPSIPQAQVQIPKHTNYAFWNLIVQLKLLQFLTKLVNQWLTEKLEIN